NALVEELAEQRTALAAAHQRLAAQVAVTRVLGEAADLAAAGRAILRALCEGLGWEMGAVWSIDPQTHRLRCGDTWHSSESERAGSRTWHCSRSSMPSAGRSGSSPRGFELRTPYVRAKSGTYSLPAAPTTGCGIGISRQIGSTSPCAGNRCWAARRTRSAAVR